MPEFPTIAKSSDGLGDLRRSNRVSSDSTWFSINSGLKSVSEIGKILLWSKKSAKVRQTFLPSFDKGSMVLHLKSPRFVEKTRLSSFSS